MNISGILIMAKPELFDSVVSALQQIEGIEVHHFDPGSGKIVITQEAETIRDEAAKAETLKEIPGVVSVNLVYHYFGEDKSLKRPTADEVAASLHS